MKNKERTVVYSLLAVSLFLGLTRPLSTVVADNPPGEATFSKLTIVGPEGEPAVVLGTNEEGSGVVRIDRPGPEGGSAVVLDMDGHGGGRVSVYTTFQSHSSGLFLHRPDGETGIYLGCSEEGSGISTMTRGGNGKISLYSFKDGEGSIVVRGPDGNVAIWLRTVKEEESNVITSPPWGRARKPGIVLGSTDEGERSIETFGLDGKRRADHVHR